MEQAERALFSESHKRCFHWIDDWFGLTYEDVRQMELENDATLNQVQFLTWVLDLEKNILQYMDMYFCK